MLSAETREELTVAAPCAAVWEAELALRSTEEIARDEWLALITQHRAVKKSSIRGSERFACDPGRHRVLV